jgi:NAD(P)-dependent dehydrogenase (short-subunit alcohol dehydrogenase family)
MTKSLKGKVALVTGGSRGIGAASARALADEGADVAISYGASADKAEAVVRDLKAKGVRAKAFKADQADSAQVERLVQDVAKEFGHLDILINNAGVAVSGAVDDPSGDTSALDRQTAINFDAVVTAIRSASKLMTDGGRIVTIGSGIATRASFPGLADYAATKAAIVGYTKGASRDLGPRGITVNVLQPGSIDTDMNPKRSAPSMRCSATAPRKKSQPAWCFSPALARRLSPARCSTSMAALAHNANNSKFNLRNIP